MAQALFSIRTIFTMALACALLAARPAPAIEIIFDYRFDDQEEFFTPPRRAALEAAGDVFRIFTDSLTAINPGTVYNPGSSSEFTDTWTAIVDHPGQSGQTNVVDMAIPANTIIVFAGGKNLSDNTLAFSGPGGFNVNGISNFVTAVSTRGQAGTTGPAPTDFGRWGGAITFDTISTGIQPRSWHSDLNTLPGPGASDLFSVAVHELGHLFGFAIGSESPLSFQTNWDQANRLFTGPKVVEVYGGPVPTASNGSAHWENGVTSTADGTSQTAVMGPTISPGVRRQFTALDYAAMADIGWQVPESVFEIPLPGDYDGNGIVNVNDYSVWVATFGSTAILAADGNGNARVDAADYTVWRDHRGASGGAGAEVALVPEPAGLAAILLALAGFLTVISDTRGHTQKSGKVAILGKNGASARKCGRALGQAGNHLI